MHERVNSISYAKGATEFNFESITGKPKHIFSVSPNLLNRAAAAAEGILVMMAIALIGENPRPRLDSRGSFFFTIAYRMRVWILLGPWGPVLLDLCSL